MKKAIIPGSFDPMTLGHRDIVMRASAIFDSVTVAVLINKDKKYMFSMEERLEIAKLTCAGIKNVDFLSSDGMLVEIASEIGAVAIVKGIRNSEDLVYENFMEKINHGMNPDINTVYLPTHEPFSEISSTLARDVLIRDGSLQSIMDENAALFAKKILNEKN